MEVCVAAGVLGLGYLFSKDGLNRENDKIYPIKNLDFPNSKRSPDITLFFND